MDLVIGQRSINIDLRSTVLAEGQLYQAEVKLNIFAYKSAIYYPFTPKAIFKSWHHFLFLDNIEKIQEKFKLSFEYF